MEFELFCKNPDCCMSNLKPGELPREKTCAKNQQGRIALSKSNMFYK